MFLLRSLGVVFGLFLLAACGPRSDQSSVGRILSNARTLADEENANIANENKLSIYRDPDSPLTVYASANVEEARLGWRELNYAWRQIPSFLGSEEKAGPGHGLNLLILKPMTAQLIAPEVGHQGTIGGSKGRLLVVVRPEGGTRKDFTDIFHETVHICLREATAGNPLPLWLEEGLAVHWGVVLALDYHNFHGASLRGAGSPLTDADRASLVAALAYGNYPDDPAAQTAFYRASRWLAAAWLAQDEGPVVGRFGDLTKEPLKTMVPADVEKLVEQALILSQQADAATSTTP